MIVALNRLVEELEQDRFMEDPDRLSQRVEALDRLETYLFHGDAGEAIHRRAAALAARLEAVNSELYRALRAAIRKGDGREALLRWFRAPPAGEGYDYLDELMAGVLQTENDHGAEPGPLAAEMVFYQPTPARHIFDLIARSALTAEDILVDLGCGMGHVALLASICTGACAIGIELEAVYIECARRSAQSLHLNNVTFLQRDARTADFSVGTLFYLYTPFTGSILRAVLDSLRREASRRRIRIATFGPCTAIVGEEPWLEADGPLEADRIVIFSAIPTVEHPRAGADGSGDGRHNGVGRGVDDRNAVAGPAIRYVDPGTGRVYRHAERAEAVSITETVPRPELAM